ncbi:MAG: hypothetical protein V4504_01295 [Patescibacteria group bacterium]
MNKKYVSLAGILLMAFALNVAPAKAEYGFSGNVDARVGADGVTTVNVNGLANPATGGVMPIKGQFKVNTEENAKLRAEMKDDRAEYKDDRDEMKFKIRANIMMNFIQRTENLTNIATRVKTRIAKMKAKGIDMTVATNFEAKAEVSIAQAKDLAIKAKASVDAHASKDEIKANFKAVKDALKQAHEYLSQAVQEIKSKVEVKANTSTTVNTNQ